MKGIVARKTPIPLSMSLAANEMVRTNALFALGSPATCFQRCYCLTRSVGIRYIWIDAICFPKDDPADMYPGSWA